LQKNTYINQNKKSAWHVMLISLFILSCSYNGEGLYY